MRGKAAAQNANRRAAEAQERIRQLERELSHSKASWKDEANQLRCELMEARQSVLREAGLLAAEEIEREREKAQQERRRLGLSDDIAGNLLYQKDKLIMNACRYISMTTGKDPIDALSLVITWCTDEDFYGFGDDAVSWLTKVGVPKDGWTVRTVRLIPQHWERKVTRRTRRTGRPHAVNLDSVEQRPGDFNVHPDYRPKWYPRVRYGEIVRDDEEPSEATA